MKLKRQKTNKRHMAVYLHSFGFREPYQLLIDGNFLQVARQTKKNLDVALPNLLNGQVRTMTTYCCYAELRKLGGEFRPTAATAKTFEKRRCVHQPAIAATDCLKEIVGDTNQFNYAVATQDQGLRAYLRSIPGVPLLYINKSVLILEPPSIATLKKVQEMEVAKTLPNANEIAVSTAKEAQILHVPIKKRKRSGEPNPLSVKRKRPLQSAAASLPKPKKQQLTSSSDAGASGSEPVVPLVSIPSTPTPEMATEMDSTSIEKADHDGHDLDTPITVSKPKRKRQRRKPKTSKDTLSNGSAIANETEESS